MTLTPGKLWGLRRLADGAGRFQMTAVDQRPPIKDFIASRLQRSDAPHDDVASVKRLLVEGLAHRSSALLLDPHFAYPAAIAAVPPSKGLILTLEDSVFVETARGRFSKSIDDWSVEKIKRIGGDAVKVLAWYRPDADPEVLEHQQEYVADIGAECRRFDIPFVFELLVYPFPDEAGHTTDYVEQPQKRTEHVLESVETFAAPRFAVDLFKLESPVPASAVPSPNAPGADAVQAAFDGLGRAAGRPWVMLSAGATQPDFLRVLHFAYEAGASGYLAGRAIWWDAFQHYPDWDAVKRALETNALPYVDQLIELTARSAAPWDRHPAVVDEVGTPLTPEFRGSYSGFAP